MRIVSFLLLIVVSNIAVGLSILCPGFIKCELISSKLSCTGTGLNDKWAVEKVGSAPVPSSRTILLSSTTGYKNFPMASDNLTCKYYFASGAYIQLQPKGYYQSSPLFQLKGKNWVFDIRYATCAYMNYSECYLSNT